MDHQEHPAKDWNYLESLFKPYPWIQSLKQQLLKVPILSQIIMHNAWVHAAHEYDVCLNFIEAHQKCKSEMERMFQDEETKETIMTEINDQVM